MVKIYFIVDINGLVYIGSTIQELKDRFASHKSIKKYNTDNTRSSILDLDNSIIECIEECTEDMRKERESYWINNIDCVNKIKYDFDSKKYKKEYSEKNREKKKEYMKEYEKLEKRKEYLEKNREKRNQQNKEYYEKNKEKIKQKHKDYYQKKKLANSN